MLVKPNPQEDLHPGDGLTDQEITTCKRFIRTGNKSGAFREGFPDKCDGMKSNRIGQAAVEFFKAEHIIGYCNFLASDPDEQVSSFLQGEMRSGEFGRQHKAASTILGGKLRSDTDSAIARYLDVMMRVGAEVVLPVPPGGGEVVVSLDQLISGEAFIRLSPKARIELLHMAGAPWNIQIPSAKLSPLQIEILNREERVLICHGGSGVGKSVLGGCLTFLGLCLPNYRTAVIADTYDHAHDEFQYAYEAFLKLFGKNAATILRCINQRQIKDMHIKSLWNSEAVIFSVGMNHGSDVLGKEFDRAVVGEASQVPPFVLNNRIYRALDRRAKVIRAKLEDGSDWEYRRNTGHASMFTTPQGYEGCASSKWDEVLKQTKNDPDSLRMDHDPQPRWAESVYLREAIVTENPAYDVEIFESRRRTLSKQAFQEQYLGMRAARTGMVFDTFSEGTHVRPMPPDELLQGMRFGLGMDTGKHFAAILAGIDMNSHFWILGETYTGSNSGGLPMSENCKQVKEMVIETLAKPLRLDTIGDPDELWMRLVDRIDLHHVDPASQQKEDIREFLETPLTFNKEWAKDFMSLIDPIRDMFREDRVTLVDSLIALPWEIKKYIWNESKTRGNASKTESLPRVRDDHAIDATRFILYPLSQAGAYVKAPEPLTFAQCWENQVRSEVFGGMKQSFKEAELPTGSTMLPPRIEG